MIVGAPTTAVAAVAKAAVHIDRNRLLGRLTFPLALIAERYFGVAGIFGAYMAANVITGVLSYIWARASIQEQCDNHATPRAPVGEVA